MIETEQSVTIRQPIDRIWDHVRDIESWANLMPGHQNCTIIDENNSRWTLKVGAGGLVRTVNVFVTVNQWNGPGHVDFAFTLERDPVEGGGTYTAIRRDDGHTDITLQVQVRGSGPMAPMWEALGKPLLPQFARAFAGQLRDRIEQAAPGQEPPLAPEAKGGLLAWLKRLFGIESIRKGEAG